MPYRWPDDTVFTRLDFNVEDGWCLTCGCKLTICDHRHRRLFTLNGRVNRNGIQFSSNGCCSKYLRNT